MKGSNPDETDNLEHEYIKKHAVMDWIVSFQNSYVKALRNENISCHVNKQ